LDQAAKIAKRWEPHPHESRRNLRRSASGNLFPLARANTTSKKVRSLLYSGLLLCCAVTLVGIYRSDLQKKTQSAKTQLRSITGTAAGHLESAHLTRLLEKYDARGTIIRNTQDASYYVLHSALSRTQLANELELPMLLLAYDSAKQELQTVVTSAERPQFRHAYDGPSDFIMAAHASSNGVEVRTAQHGDLLLAAAPLLTPDGDAVAVVLVQRSLATLAQGAEQQLLRNIVLAIAFFVLLGVALFRSIGRWVQQAEQKHDRLAKAHGDVQDNLLYAGKITRALVPPLDAYRHAFAEAFVLDKPKHAVGGDFHWMHRTEEGTCWIATADCTGHGASGAIVAALGVSLLTEVVTQAPKHDPAYVLAELNRRMVRALHQEGRSRGAGDGMDIALCHVDQQRREVLFAGAYRPLYWIHEGQLNVINGDRKPIGGSQHELDRTFAVHRLMYAPGDRFYLFSDGYTDQFGGPERRKFMGARLGEALLHSAAMAMQEQHLHLERTFAEWMGELEQVDDVCMLGIAV
jgi:serine phosphatase RsbU (regulator of sigma subunit)